MGIFTNRVVAHDFETLEKNLQGWDHEYHQIAAGSFGGDLLISQIGGLQISRNRWGRRLCYRGTSPPDTFGLAVTLNQCGEGRWLGVPTRKTTAIFQNNGAEAEFVSPESWDSLVIAVPQQEFTKQLRALLGNEAEALPDLHGAVALQPEAYSRIRRAGLDYFSVLERSLENSVTSALLAPLAQSLQSLVVGELAAAGAVKFEKPTLNRARRIVRKTEAYVAEIENFPVRIENICDTVGVSARTLYYAFTHTVGMTPTHWLRIRRLNQVHRVLRGADPTNTLVKQVAIDEGFLHLGHFSHHYKQLFGEKPSETLRL